MTVSNQITVKTMIRSYKDLVFWQTAKTVSLQVVKLTRKFPNERTYWIIADQVIRSSFSVGANIAEGFGKYKGKEYPRFLSIALGSANETEYWLELIVELYPTVKEDVDIILHKNMETIKMLTSSLSTIRKKSQTQ